MATSIRLAPDTERRLDFLATQTGRTKAFYLREIIERGIEDMEDYYLAADVVERLRQGRERVYSAAEARKGRGNPLQAFMERAARLRQKTAGRAHTPAETLIRDDRRRRAGIDR